MIGDSVNSIDFKEKSASDGVKWRDGSIWLLFGIVVVYFSISFSSRVVDYVDENHFYYDYKRYNRIN
ncbi:conserved hypothetical protein [Candidatus Liberibacter solanacearum]|uniref:hypothetical protein n=1 Tax=Candidatus Liberibacter solanacearum TaxID=556287 RepID=UPI0038722AA4